MNVERQNRPDVPLEGAIMPKQSTACILVKDLNLTYHFTGVTSITHSLSLKIMDQADMTEQGSFVNGAKNQPDSVTLSVVETDAAHSARGWAERMLDVLASVKHRRLLCRVVTPHHTYDNMLLSAVTAIQNEYSPDGWSGELTFTEYIPAAVSAENKTNDNGSAARNTGSAAPPAKAAGEAIATGIAGGVLKAAGSLSTAVLAVDPAGTLGMKLQGGGINPNLVRVVNCVE